MKTISQLRNALKLNPSNINYGLGYMADKLDLDFDVYLPTKGINLQRGYVWDLSQKREIIWSILMGRHIPRMSLIASVNADYSKEIYQIIDGKQRLSSMIDFYRGEFTLLVDGSEYYYNELPTDYQRTIKGYALPINRVFEDNKGDITDQDKIDWFKYINFAGTPQDQEHFDLLDKTNDDFCNYCKNVLCDSQKFNNSCFNCGKKPLL